ncbi:hypothetical protein SDC9_95474 [bioreactor metagenome]|uniref:PHP domain-containing protein n=1 Tax=bioreactor metagenome TaxID=1076179 RepID=A0A645A6Q9_9ZZZZ
MLHNMHCHTCYSYNGYGYAPAYIAYLAKKSGWLAAGIIDFDVLDAVNEFRESAEELDLNYSCGIETRVFVKELADVAINSPGEPGIAYHLGLGFDTEEIPPCVSDFSKDMRAQASGRISRIIDLVNTVLDPVRLDFEADVAVLTPSGNATERHLCRAYREKAEQLFSKANALVDFWSGKLGIPVEDAEKVLADPVKLEAKIRSKTMKKGGAGYIAPAPDTFPPLEAFNQFIQACGAIPTIAWLNGLSKGEADVDRLLDLHMEKGAAMLNIIPDRNCFPEDPRRTARHVAELDRVIAACIERDLPIVIGTEMNAPGLKHVDDLGNEALRKHTDTFVTGARILSGHTLFAKLNRGYLSEWARRELPDRGKRNVFYARLGECLTPARFESVREWPAEAGKVKNILDGIEPIA